MLSFASRPSRRPHLHSHAIFELAFVPLTLLGLTGLYVSANRNTNFTLASLRYTCFDICWNKSVTASVALNRPLELSTSHTTPLAQLLSNVSSSIELAYKAISILRLSDCDAVELRQCSPSSIQPSAQCRQLALSTTYSGFREFGRFQDVAQLVANPI